MRRRKPLEHPAIQSVQNLLVPLKSQLSKKLRPPLLHTLAAECCLSNIIYLTSFSFSVSKVVSRHLLVQKPVLEAPFLCSKTQQCSPIFLVLIYEGRTMVQKMFFITITIVIATNCKNNCSWEQKNWVQFFFFLRKKKICVFSYFNHVKERIVQC